MVVLMVLFPVGVVLAVVLLAVAASGSTKPGPTQQRQDAEARARRAEWRQARLDRAHDR